MSPYLAAHVLHFGLLVAKQTQPTNPFYVLLIVAGIAFAVTASAYGVMTLKAFSPPQSQANSAAGQQLLTFLDEHGMLLLVVELIVLGIATFGAMATDSYWQKQNEAGRMKQDAD